MCGESLVRRGNPIESSVSPTEVFLQPFKRCQAFLLERPVARSDLELQMTTGFFMTTWLNRFDNKTYMYGCVFLILMLLLVIGVDFWFVAIVFGFEKSKHSAEKRQHGGGTARPQSSSSLRT